MMKITIHFAVGEQNARVVSDWILNRYALMERLYLSIGHQLEGPSEQDVPDSAPLHSNTQQRIQPYAAISDAGSDFTLPCYFQRPNI